MIKREWTYIIKCFNFDLKKIRCICWILYDRDVGGFCYKNRTNIDLSIFLEWLLRRRLFQSIESKNRWFLKSSKPFFPSRWSIEQRSFCNKSFASFDASTSSGNESGIYTNKFQLFIQINRNCHKLFFDQLPLFVHKFQGDFQHRMEGHQITFPT